MGWSFCPEAHPTKERGECPSIAHPESALSLAEEVFPALQGGFSVFQLAGCSLI